MMLTRGILKLRPVTLFGFSLGARVIFKCLQHLAESEGNGNSLVINIIMHAYIYIGEGSCEKKTHCIFKSHKLKVGFVLT